MASSNKDIARRLIEEIWNKRNTKVADELIAKDAVSHDPTNPNMRGPEGMKQQSGIYIAGFPDVRMTIDAQIAEGDLVVTRWTARGTHEGNLMGAAATHKRVTVTGIQIDKIANGKVVESWVNWDTAGMLQQIGLAPLMGTGTGTEAATNRPAGIHK